MSIVYDEKQYKLVLVGRHMSKLEIKWIIIKQGKYKYHSYRFQIILDVQFVKKGPTYECQTEFRNSLFDGRGRCREKASGLFPTYVPRASVRYISRQLSREGKSG